MKAFVLGAGLGTRLKEITEWLPKPLVPVFHRPLIAFAFDHLLEQGVESVAVNTHHCPDSYARLFPSGRYRNCPLTFRHEPILRETAGGIWNVSDLLEGGPFLVYNGDILTDIPLGPLAEAHRSQGNEVTLLLRSEGPGLHIGFQPRTGEVRDIRQMLGQEKVEQWCQFTGIYMVEPSFLKRLTPEKKESVIPIFLEMIKEGGRLGGILGDEGSWWDIGDPESYRGIHQWLPASDYPLFGGETPSWAPVHERAEVGTGVSLSGSCVGSGAEVGLEASLENSIVWPGASVPQGACLKDEVVRGEPETFFVSFKGWSD
ncbi:MAG: sugar phosphate nucleotidyltransferase [Verrucomicrobiota bacterium]